MCNENPETLPKVPWRFRLIHTFWAHYALIIKIVAICWLIGHMFQAPNLLWPLIAALVIPWATLRLGHARITLYSMLYMIAIFAVPTAILSGLAYLWQPEAAYLVALGVYGFFISTQDIIH
jgi:hypothetical protein